jgi:hypothetical protein
MTTIAGAFSDDILNKNSDDDTVIGKKSDYALDNDFLSVDSVGSDSIVSPQPYVSSTSTSEQISPLIDSSTELLVNNDLDFSSSFSNIPSALSAGTIDFGLSEDIAVFKYRQTADLGQLDNSQVLQETNHFDAYPVDNDNTLTGEKLTVSTNIVPVSTASSTSSVDLSQAFKLHSNPNAKHTIYLDFDGNITQNNYLNNVYGAQIISPAYDTDGNAAVFSDSEFQSIIGAWQQVAEDFAPFDINVTTEAPSDDDLLKSGTNDTRWGLRVVITQNVNLYNNSVLYPNVGGFAPQFNSFNTSLNSPAFVFSVNHIGLTTSHEVGHTLGLSHDGQTFANPGDPNSQEYYRGFGAGETSWGPIMGGPFSRQMTQWSKGEYQFATNQQDDLAIITANNGFGYRVDDYGDSLNAATQLYADASNKISTFGLIERNTDKDVFSFLTGTGNISLNIQTASRSYVSNGIGTFDVQYLDYLDVRGPNIDLWAGIYDASGTLVAESNPADLRTANFTNLFLNAGLYYLQIDGVGKAGINGYSDYGSLGQYAINGVLTSNNTAPILSQALVDQTAIEDAPFTWTLPANTFTDADVGDVLTFTATLANGTALPTWLTFDAVTKTFSGTPDNAQVGAIDIKIVATDTAGAKAEDIFQLTVQNVNDAPTLQQAISDQSLYANTALNFTLPTGTFSDIDAGDVLTYTATLANGNALPSWLTFNANTLTFSGTPTTNNKGTLDIKVVATDLAGAQAEDTFKITVSLSGSKPVRNDFNNDQKSDILWYTPNGDLYEWQMNGTFIASYGYIARGVTLDWKVADTGDFNGDYKSDILWRNDNGGVVIWQMDGLNISSWAYIAGVSLDWSIAGVGDFNRDNKSDILWRNDNGDVVIWQMDGTSVTYGGYVGRVTSDWKIAGTGDFNGDNKSDILWRNDNGDVVIWQMDGTSIAYGGYLGGKTSDWKIAGTGDFNGDNKSDILWRNDDGDTAIWQMDGTSIAYGGSIVRGGRPTLDWKVADIVDLNGDNKSDILWRNDNGSVAQWQMDGASVAYGDQFAVGLTSDWNFAGLGDFNFDYKTDIIRRNDNGDIYQWTMYGTSIAYYGYIASGITPDWKIAGTNDFNGDNISDILWRNDNGDVTLWQMDSLNIASSGYIAKGVTSDWKIAGTDDFNGDNKADILWRNDNGGIAFWQMDGTSIASSGYIGGVTLDWKIAGTDDFNGDNKADILWSNDNGDVVIWQMDGTSIASSGYLGGVTSDWKIAGTGDFNGDNKADILWRNDNGSIVAWQMDGTSIATSGYLGGVTSDWSIVGVGDFSSNGDNKADILWKNIDGTNAMWFMDGTTIASSGYLASADSSWNIV